MFNLRRKLSNILGWQTNRKLIVFESDDWGSIRTRSKWDFHEMESKGLLMNLSNFTKYDSLETNNDLENLFNLLSKHKDSTGRPPVFTPMCIIANPDFDKIQESDFKTYYYQTLIETCSQIPNSNLVPELWKKGINDRLFVPQLHGREHLNVARWMRGLQSDNLGLKIAFQHRSIGATFFKGNILPEYLAAFNPESKDDINDFEEIILDAGLIFSNICGYKPQNFIASDSPEPRRLESTLKKIGVNYLTRYKIQKYPLGEGRFEMQFNWLGKENNINQIYLTRNAGFEPSANLNNWVDSCLNEIKDAFYAKKPAIISSHRVNYVGNIVPANASGGLFALDNLLTRIIKQWPDIEFVTSRELGDIIRECKNEK